MWVRFLQGGLNITTMVTEQTIKKFVLDEFQLLLEENKRNVTNIVKLAENNNLTNEQCYIDWENYLNEISVKDHNN